MAEYQVVKIEDVEDWLGDYPGEMRGITYAIGAEQVAITYRRMPQHTGSKGSYGHRHKTQEEIYILVNGSARMKLDDELVEMTPLTAVRVSPETMRGYEAGPAGAELIVIGTPRTGGGDADTVAGWWAD